jgi:hypothetical protein
MVKVVPLPRNVLWDCRMRSGNRGTVREAPGLEEGDIFQFCWFPSAGGGRRSWWECDEIFCCLCEGLLGWASMGNRDAYVIGDGGPLCGGDKGFDD